MSAGIQRAKDSFVVIDGDADLRRGIVIGKGDKILTALHDLRKNTAFKIFLPENNASHGARVSMGSLHISANEALDAAIIYLPGTITDTWAAVAGKKSLNPFAARHLITDVSGAIETQKLAVNKDATSNLQYIFDESDIRLDARNFEVLRANAQLGKTHSGSIITNGNGEVQAIVSGVINDRNKSLKRRASGLLGGKSNDFFVTKQNVLARFIDENIHS